MLTEKIVRLTGGRMGRPPLGMISTNIGLPPGVAERITAIVGQKRMALFIREAVMKALEQAEAERDGRKPTRE